MERQFPADRVPDAEPVRVLVISHLFPLVKSPGLGIFLVRELETLGLHGFEFDVAVVRPWAPAPLTLIPRWRRYARTNAPLVPSGLNARVVRYLRPPGFWYRRWEGRMLARRLRGPVRSWHKERDYDLVLASSMFPEAEAGCDVAKVLDLPLAAMAVGSDVRVIARRSAALSARLARVLRCVDLPIGVSQELCERLADAAPLAVEPLLVYLGRDTSLFAPAADRSFVRRELGWSQESIVAAYVGALWRAKGIDELARVIPELLARHSGLRFVCIGEGEGRSTLVEAARRSGREGSVVLPGYLPPEEVPRYLQAADIFVFPSHSEGMPQAVLEAMNCGLPVVATRVGGVPEAVVDGETGLLVEPGDTAQLAAAIERIISDDAFRERAGRAGLARAREKFDPEAHAARFAQALHRLVRRGRRVSAPYG